MMPTGVEHTSIRRSRAPRGGVRSRHVAEVLADRGQGTIERDLLICDPVLYAEGADDRPHLPVPIVGDPRSFEEDPVEG